MELNQLRYFQTVAKYQQMTRAAEELHISQSSLSKTISTLEQNMGTRLFDRIGNRIVLNSTGRAFLQRVDRILVDLEDAVQEATARDRGSVFFAANISGLCTDYLDAFLRSHPNVSLQQSLMDPAQMIEALENGSLDCALSFVDISSEQISWTHLVDEALLVLVSKQHPLADRKEIAFAELQNEHFVCTNSGFGVKDILLKQGKLAGFQPNILFDGNEPELAFKLVAENLGVMMMSSIVYSWLMGMKIVNPPLHYISALRITGDACYRPLGIAVRKGHYLSPTASAFLEGLAAHFSAASAPMP